MDNNDRNKAGLPNQQQQQAKAQLARTPALTSVAETLSAEEIQRLVHELQVHQIELETQNEELRQAHELVEESRNRYLELYDYAPVGYLTIAATGLIEEVNLTASIMLGTERMTLEGQHLTNFVDGEYKDTLYLHRRRLLDGDGAQTFELRMRRSGGSRLHAEVKMVRMEETGGESSGYRVVISDISKRKEAEERIKTSLEEKEMLLREIHHRVKNNMQVICSLLNLQGRRIQNKEAIKALKESRQRVMAMAMAHENLYRTRDFVHLKLSDYVSSLVSGIQQSCGPEGTPVTVKTRVADLPVNMDQAIPLGLIINELMTNVLKHAFPRGYSGTLTLSIEPRGKNEVLLVVADNGVGFPEEMDWRHPDSMGLMLVTELCGQLHGEVSLDRSHGTRWQIVFERKRP